jgi:hypothetical protein
MENLNQILMSELEDQLASDQVIELRKKHRLSVKKAFGGTTDPYNDSVRENYIKDLDASEYMSFHKKHLKAYLQGSTHFRYKGKTYKVQYSYGDKTSGKEAQGED